MRWEGQNIITIDTIFGISAIIETNIYGTAAKYMKQILGFSTTCKKFSPQQ